jgi:hypothetical protein
MVDLMDYALIYEVFIINRKAKPIAGLYEIHHVLPRSLGGPDDPDNLIKLSLQDHLFAHLLLSKIYRGPMSIAFILMLGMSRYSGRRSRKIYAEQKADARAAVSLNSQRRWDDPDKGPAMKAAASERVLKWLADPERAASRAAKISARMMGNQRTKGRKAPPAERAAIGLRSKGRKVMPDGPRPREHVEKRVASYKITVAKRRAKHERLNPTTPRVYIHSPEVIAKRVATFNLTIAKRRAAKLAVVCDES